MFTLRGHLPEQHNSQTQLTSGAVSQAARCRMQVEVLPDTESGEHKVKIMGVIASDAGWAELANNGMMRSEFSGGGALAQAHDI